MNIKIFCSFIVLSVLFCQNTRCSDEVFLGPVLSNLLQLPMMKNV